MNYLKRYPQMAYASLGLLVAAVLLMWAEWITTEGSSVVGALIQLLPNMEAGISFAEGCSVAKELAELSEKAGGLYGEFLGNELNTAISIIKILSIAYITLFCGTILAVGYCIYARLTWKSGLREGIYFLFFASDVAVTFVLANLLDKALGGGAIKMGIWGFVALGCALLSEVLWEEASFNTPKPGTEAWDKRQELLRNGK